MANAVGDGPQVPGGEQEMPQDAFDRTSTTTLCRTEEVNKYQAEANNDPFPHDGAQEESAGSQLAVPEDPQVLGRQQQMPERLTIGTRKAFERNYAFPYSKTQIGSETIYVCSKGSDLAHANEVLVLRCVAGTWTAFDSDVSADGLTLQCRQPVFRCLATDITQPGWHKWQTNYNASPDDGGLEEDWQGALWAESRVE